MAIGTHDLSTIEGPFTYEALPPKDISFAPLNRPGQVMDGEKLMQVLEGDRHLNKYLPIIRDSPVYPVILDKNRTVCSLPPIINSDHSKITLKTTDVFIDMTATDETRLESALNILVAMFSEYCSEPFTIEPIKVTYADGRTSIQPSLAPRKTTARLSYINSCTGLSLDTAEVAKFLNRMGHEASPSKSNPTDIIDVDVACTRPDVLHECDLMEDVAVAFGFDNLPRRFPSTNTVAAPLPINKLSDLIRRECAYAGWTEVLPLILVSDMRLAISDSDHSHRASSSYCSALELKTFPLCARRMTVVLLLWRILKRPNTKSFELRCFQVYSRLFEKTECMLCPCEHLRFPTLLSKMKRLILNDVLAMNDM